MVHAGVLVPVQTATDVAASRRAALQTAEAAGLNETTAGAASIIATEAATNLLKHAGGGEIVFSLIEGGGAIEIIALDKGPGMPNPRACFEDGYSTSGSCGTGLGAMRRLSSSFDWFTAPGLGTAIICRVGSGRPISGRAETGAIHVPYPGETIAGDCWATCEFTDFVRIAVADGLGHGMFANQASAAAVALATDPRYETPAALMEAMHAKLRPTRGAAASVADIYTSRGYVDFCGVGNVSGSVLSGPDLRRQMLTANGTLGHEMRKAPQYRYPAPPGSLIVLHSDGLSANWSIGKYPGLFQRTPSVTAGVIFRDCRRLRDDVNIVVVRVREQDE